MNGQLAGQPPENAANAPLVQPGTGRDFLQRQTFSFQEKDIAMVRRRQFEHLGPQVLGLSGFARRIQFGIGVGFPFIILRQVRFR